MIVPVRLEKSSYDIHIYSGSYIKLGEALNDGNKKFFLVADRRAYEFHGKRFLDEIRVKPAGIFLVQGEKEKNLSTVSDILEEAAGAGMTRGDCFVSFGGGVCGDITGFCAAIFMRGVEYYQVPTTLLAQVDSSVGGKTGVDLEKGKNLAGAFKQPAGVYIDTQVIKTLEESEIRQGKAEMIKAAAINDEELFTAFEERMEINETNILRCIEIKLSHVKDDEFDHGVRMMLNFGHTIAHGLENTVGYGEISHGEAVAMGMAMSVAMSENAGLTEIGTAKRLKNLLIAQGLPVSCQINLGELGKAMNLDKKIKGGMLSAVFLRCIGNAFIKEMTIEDFIGLGDGIWT